MAKYIDSVEVNLKMWATVSLSAEDIQDIYPEFEDMTDFSDTDALEEAIQEHMDMNYIEHIQFADGALDQCAIKVVLKDGFRKKSKKLRK